MPTYPLAAAVLSVGAVNWPVIGGVAVVVILLLGYSLCVVASRSDRRIAAIMDREQR